MVQHIAQDGVSRTSSPLALSGPTNGLNQSKCGPEGEETIKMGVEYHRGTRPPPSSASAPRTSVLLPPPSRPPLSCHLRFFGGGRCCCCCCGGGGRHSAAAAAGTSAAAAGSGGKDCAAFSFKFSTATPPCPGTCVSRPATNAAANPGPPRDPLRLGYRRRLRASDGHISQAVCQCLAA